LKKSPKDIKTLSEAIAHLEKAGSEKSEELKETFGESFEEIKKAFLNLKPHIDELTDKVETEARKTKKEVEHRVKENPWILIGVATVIGFILGCLFFRKRD